jgi:hypothetical protein
VLLVAEPVLALTLILEISPLLKLSMEDSLLAVGIKSTEIIQIKYTTKVGDGNEFNQRLFTTHKLYLCVWD